MLLDCFRWRFEISFSLLIYGFFPLEISFTLTAFTDIWKYILLLLQYHLNYQIVVFSSHPFINPLFLIPTRFLVAIMGFANDRESSPPCQQEVSIRQSFILKPHRIRTLQLGWTNDLKIFCYWKWLFWRFHNQIDVTTTKWSF